jgi:stage II sporulation protein D
LRRRLAAVLAGWLGAAWAGLAAAEPQIRVLLLERAEGVRVGAEAGPRTRLEPAPGGLRAGSRPVGPVWRLEGDLLRVDRLRVRGEVEVRRVSGGLQVVNRVPIEHYVAGTLGRETYPGWALETFKAQAVATRSYALHEAARHADGPFDVEGGTRGQVYGGVDAESPQAVAAAAATRGEYLAWRGRPILAVFHSASGGRTASAEEVWGRALPYLVSVPVEHEEEASGGRTASAEEVWGRALPYLVSVPVEHEEDSPDTYWRASVSRTTLGRALVPLGVQVGPVRELRVVERSLSGRARSVQVRGRDGEKEIEARALRESLGAKVIRSTLFEIRATPDGFLIVGSGHGHGVGMSQWGAEAMARRGAGYREILASFYPGTELLKEEAR